MSSETVNYTEELALRDARERDHIVRELEAIKDQYGIRSARILELGCGVGMNLLVFAGDNEVQGVDGLPEAVSAAKARGIPAHAANLEALLPDLGTFDWILLLGVLEHLVAPKRLLEQAKQALRPSGRIILNVPNHFTLSGRVKMLLGSNLDHPRYFPAHDEWDNPHLRFFTRRGLYALVEACGLRVVDDRSAHFPAVPLLGKAMPQAWLRGLAGARPSLFAGGIFVIAEPADTARA